MTERSVNIRKHTSRNPVMRFVVARFNRDVAGMAASVSPKTVLDIGCGEGFTTSSVADGLPGTRFTALDKDEAAVAYARAHSQRPNISYGKGDIFSIKGRFDLVMCNEVLEHIERFDDAVESIMRAGSHVLISVPNEPFFRIANVARLSYLTRLGNPPGHVNHWRKGQLKDMLSAHGQVVRISTSTFWSIALARRGGEE